MRFPICVGRDPESLTVHFVRFGLMISFGVVVFVVDNLPEKEFDAICKVPIFFKFPNSVGRDPILIE